MLLSRGFLVAPGVAGYLADPIGVRHISGDSAAANFHWITGVLERYPYLLPNLLGAVLCWSTLLGVHFGLPETLSECRDTRDLRPSRWNEVPPRQSPDSTLMNYGSIDNGEHTTQQQQNSRTNARSLSTIWSNHSTRYHLLAYWFYSFIIIGIDEAFPLYCVSQNNGLHGLSEKEIGEILSLSGLIFSLLQYRVYSEWYYLVV